MSQKSLSITSSFNSVMPKGISTEELSNLIKSGESASFEYKGELNREIKERLSTYFAAFANTVGGLFVLGINNFKETVGCILEKGDREYISQEAKNCHPPVYIDVEEGEYDNNKIVLVYIHNDNKTIHTDKNYRFPVRVGSNLAYLDITGIIPLARERLGLTYGMGRTEFPIGILRERAKIVKNKALPEDIELCLNAIGGATKDVRLEGLRELEDLIFKNDLSDRPRVLEVLEVLLKDTDIETRRYTLDIIKIFIRVTEKEESRKKLINRYILNVINLAKHDPNLEVRSSAISVLVEMSDEHGIEPIISIVLNESDEIYNKLKYSFNWQREYSSAIKRQLKSRLLKELGDPNKPENIRKRIREVIEESRRT